MIFSVAFFSHGKAFVTAGADKTARIWDVATGKAKFILDGHRHAVEAVAVSPDDRIVATASWDHTVKFWDAETGKETAVIDGHRAPVYAVAFSQDGKLLATSAADGSVRLWDAKTHQALAFLGNHASAAWTVAFSHDGKLLASGGSDKTAKLWDVVNGKELATLATGEFKPVRALAYAPDGKEVAIATEEKTVQLVDAVSGAVRQVLSGPADIVTCLAFSHDGKLLAGGSFDRTIHVWDRMTGEEKRVLEGHSGDIYALAFNREGKLASASEDKTVKVWNPDSGEELASFKGHVGPVRAVAFAPDGVSLASGSADKTIRFWYLDKTPSITLNGHDGAICALAFSGARLASAGADGTVKVWQTGPGKIFTPAPGREPLTLKGHTGEVSAVAFLRGGRTLVSGGQDTNVIVWDPVSGNVRGVLKGHSEPVSAVAIHPQGRDLLSGSLDTTVLRWQNSKGQPATALTGLVPVSPNKPKQAPRVETAPTAAPKANYQQEYYHSFKGNPENTDDFQMIGPGVDECVKFERAGLRVTLPIGHHGNQGTGLATQFAVKGDFEITLGFELLQEPAPQDTGRATGLYLGVDLNTVSYNRATLTRGVRQERQFLSWFQLSTEGSDKPYRDELRVFRSTGLTGRLRLVRGGATLAHYVAEGNRADFVFLREHPFGEHDVRAIRLGGQNGGPKASLDARIIDLRVRADSLPGMPEVPAAVREAGEKLWLGLAASLSTLIALSLAGSLYLRRRRRVAPAPSPSLIDKNPDGRNAAPASVSFSCSGCQNKLRARAELAGRSVKCPRCGQAVLIPSIKE